MDSIRGIRFTAIACVLFTAFLISAVALPPGARTALAASGWEKQDPGISDQLISVSAADALTAWAVGMSSSMEPRILKTVNAGSPWVAQSAGATGGLLGVDAVDESTAWAVGMKWESGENSTLIPAGALVLRTTDDGDTWKEMNPPSLSPGSTWDVVPRGIKAVDENTALVCGLAETTGDGGSQYRDVIAKTTDGAEQWTYPYLNLTDMQQMDLRPYSITAGSDSVLYATGHRDVLKSTDAGDHWTVIMTEPAGSMHCKVDAVDADTAWLATQGPLLDGSTYGTMRVLKTTDGGATWAPKLKAGVGAAAASSCSIESAGPQAAWAVGNKCIYRTEDGGETWAVQFSDINTDLVDVGAFDSLNAWAVGAGGAILHTSDGGGAGQPVTLAQSLTPGSGLVGTEVSIKGSGFGGGPGASSVHCFNATQDVEPAEYTLWTDTEIRFNLPELEAGAAGVAVQTTMMSEPLPFTVTDVVPPTVSAIAPNRGVSLGSGIKMTLAATVTGTGFQGGAQVRLVRGTTNIEATDEVRTSDTTITCKLKLSGRPLGRYDVYVTNPDGGQGMLSQGFRVVNACGLGGAASVSAFAGLLGLLSLAGFGWRRKRFMA